MLTLDQMTTLLHYAAGLPHQSTADVFEIAGTMAVAVEKMTNGHVKKIKIAKQVKKTTTKKRARKWKRDDKVTKRTLRDLGLDYPTVADCAHDLVITKGMSLEAAAKRMNSDYARVRSCLINYKAREIRKGLRKMRAENAERKA